jgi:serine protease Do
MSTPSPARFSRFTVRQALLAATAVVVLVAVAAPQFVQPVQAQLQAPAGSARAQNPGFADVVDRVKGAVVSVQITRAGDDAQAANAGPRGGGGAVPGLPDLPPDHPLNRFFREFQERAPARPDQRGEGRQGQRQQPQRAPTSQGSGFFISADGFIVTNAHVVRGGSGFTVVMDDGVRLPARLIGADDRTDLAVLKAERPQPFPFVGFTKTTSRVGEWVVAIGNPFGLGGTVTAGIVSARGRDIGAGPYDDFLQIDAPVNRGNSGGPTFNLDGEVIGINTAIYSPTGGSVGIGFAIPAATAERVIAQLRSNGSVTRGWLGVSIQPVTEELARTLNLPSARGALVSEPQADGPAAKAGIRAGDAILTVNGQQITDGRDLARRVADIAPGTTARVELIRGGERRTINVEVGTLPNQQAAATRPQGERGNEPRPTTIPTLGLTIAPTREGGRGVVIVRVEPESRAASQGLRRGDVIVEVAGEAVGTPQELQAQLEAARSTGRNSVLTRVRTGERSRFVALPIDRS